MTTCTVQAETPAPLAELPDSEAFPMSSQSPWQAPRDPSPSGQFTVSKSGTFRRVSPLVPDTGVLVFGPDGRAEGVRADPAFDPALMAAADFAVWVQSTLDILDADATWSPADIADWEPKSNQCAFHWTVDPKLKIPFFCTLDPDHLGDHEAWGVSEVKATRKRPTPRTRKAV